MSTRGSGETRRRWTEEQRRRLEEETRAFRTVPEAAEALYVAWGVPLRVMQSQLYDMFTLGRLPHLELVRPRDSSLGVTPRMAKALRELVRVMRSDGATDALVSVRGAQVQVQLSRQGATFDLEF